MKEEALEREPASCDTGQDGPVDLQSFLACLERVGNSPSQVSVQHLIDAIGSRSFGPMILLPGVLAISPLTGIPGIATAIAVFVMLVSGQLLLGRDHFWLPRWVLQRSVSRGKLRKSLRLLQKPARWVDKVVKSRLRILTSRPAHFVTALLCILIAATMPVLDLVPFANTTAGLALTSFALSLIARDGLLFLLALGFCTGILWFILELLVF
ncbi:exopolysaccharide biosynthesis protein [Pseudomonas oryzihabitans]|uniref:exopolysaccharide biosynthesis protein n=1 Tax=Pseudomonas oryzihabitans TaxID=47885 RepID=UPI0011A6F153|nr:exopolysaccharide biosynthesis protein [Pseudomonas oryzihabitans]